MFDRLSILDRFSRSEITHAGAFLGGMFLTLGFFATDNALNNVAYDRETDAVASVVQATNNFEEVPSIPVATTTEEVASSSEDITEESFDATSLQEGRDSQEQDDPVESEEAEVVDEQSEEIPSVVEETEDTTEEDNAALQEQVAAALASAQEQLSDLQSQASEQEEEETQATTASSDDDVQCFSTPNGKKIDQYGNELNDDCSQKNNASIPGQPSITNNGDGTVTKIAEGYFQLPNGKWSDANGNLYDEPPTITQAINQQQVQDDIVTLASGVVINRRTGVVISRPEEPEVETVPATVIGDTPPEVGSTINIPRYVETRIYNNPQIPCDNFQFSTNDEALCELYRNNYDDYTWNKVDSE